MFSWLQIMTEYNKAYVIWNSIISKTITKGRCTFPKFMENGTRIPSPDETLPKIFQRHVGEPKGQLLDWRASFANSSAGFHAVEFFDRYETHIDSVDPLKYPLGHLIEDSPVTFVLLIILFLIAIASIFVYIFARGE